MFRSKIRQLLKKLATVSTISLLVACSSFPAGANGTKVVVIGEDSNPRSVVRDSEIFKRVVSQLQETMNRGGYHVVDEDMLAVKLGFSFNTRRPKAELIETLMVANDTHDATVQSRLAVVFAIFPSVKELSFSKKLEVRIRGDIYDLKTLSPLASFEYKPKKAYLIPKDVSQCDAYCIEEIVGKNARTVARELGTILTKKLKVAVSKIDGASTTSTDNSSVGALPVTYNFSMIYFSVVEAIKIKKAMMAFSDVTGFETLSVESSQRQIALTSKADIGVLEEHIIEAVMLANVNADNISLNMSGTDIELENLN